MTSRQHQDWINRGRPDSGLARPLAQLRDVLRAAGFTVYDWPDDSHLDAEPPEDHTFYSETGWPSTSPKWWRHAIDIMPKPGPDGAAQLYDLGNRIYLDRAAGKITWLKYINTPRWRGQLDQARQYRWEPGLQVGSSSDVGHIHMSCITGVETLDAPYNPLVPMGAAGEEGDMSALFTDNLAREIDAMFNAKSTVSLDVGGGAMKPFPVPLVEHVLGLEKALADLGAKFDALAAKLQAAPTSAPATGDVTVSGTLHLG